LPIRASTPSGFDLEHSQEERIVLGGEAHTAEKGGVGNRRLDSFGRAAADHSLEEPVLRLRDTLVSPYIINYGHVSISVFLSIREDEAGGNSSLR